jgi:FkbM family methyltransferase
LSGKILQSRMNKNISARLRRQWRFWRWRLATLPDRRKIARFSLPEGILFDYPLSSTIGALLSMEEYENPERDFVRRCLRSGGTFLDIGANAGLYTLLAAQCVGDSGRVYAFEPGQRELELLRHNIRINQFTNVTVVDSAVSSVNGTARFAESSDGAMSSLARTKHPGQKIVEWRSVSTLTLDDAVENFQIGKIDFIKMDVEGAEKLVMEGATRTLQADDNPIILFEASEMGSAGFGYTVPDFLAEIQRKGLRIYYFDAHGKLQLLTSRDFSRPELGRGIYNFVASRRAL